MQSCFMRSLFTYLRRVQIKVEYGQLPEMATAFGVRVLGTALVVSCGFYRLPGQDMRWASFPSSPEYRSGLPKRFQAPALQRLRRSDLCARFTYLLDVHRITLRKARQSPDAPVRIFRTWARDGRPAPLCEVSSDELAVV